MAKEKDQIIYNVGCPDWMLTMGDCMSLLLCFFVLLMVFSTPDTSKLMMVIGCLQGALGMSDPPILKKNDASVYKPDDEGVGGEMPDGVKELLNIDKDNLSPVKLRTLKIKNRFNEFKNKITEMGFKNIVTTEQIDEGIAVRISVASFFVKDKAEIQPAVMPAIQGYANMAESVGNEVRVTIYLTKSMNESANAKFEWGLARERLAAVGQVLNQKYGVVNNRLSFGIAVKDDDSDPIIELLIAEKYSTSEVDFKSIINQDKM